MAGGKRCSYTNQHCLDENQFQCSQSLGQSPICVPYNLTCDGLEHCPDGSDEDVRYCAVRSCKKGFFGEKCENGIIFFFSLKLSIFEISRFYRLFYRFIGILDRSKYFWVANTVTFWNCQKIPFSAYIAIKHDAAKIIVYIYNINKENWRFKVRRYYYVYIP